MKNYYFISGLPRSGSTLLSSVLNQNKNVYAGVTSPVLQLIRNVYEILNTETEFKTFLNDRTSKNILSGIFDSYYKDQSKNIVFDTNRMWPNMIYLLKEIYPKTKILLCVRDIPWILDSFEVLRNKNPLSIPNIYPAAIDLNVYSRTNYLMSENGLVGSSYKAVKSVMTGPFSDDIMFIDYNEFCKNPAGMMKAVYNFIEQPYYEHDFNNVSSEFDSYDLSIGIKDMHKTRKNIEFLQRSSIIPPDLWAKYNGLEVWKN